MTTFDRIFDGILVFAVVSFIWIGAIEKYAPLIWGNLLGLALAICLVIWGKPIFYDRKKKED